MIQLFFGEPQLLNFCVKEIFRIYEAALYQAINLSKSDNMFSDGIPRERGELANVFGVRWVE